jgi:hypothetical protein
MQFVVHKGDESVQGTFIPVVPRQEQIRNPLVGGARHMVLSQGQVYTKLRFPGYEDNRITYCKRLCGLPVENVGSVASRARVDLIGSPDET